MMHWAKLLHSILTDVDAFLNAGSPVIVAVITYFGTRRRRHHKHNKEDDD
jgi:hypothetical protein